MSTDIDTERVILEDLDWDQVCETALHGGPHQPNKDAPADWAVLLYETCPHATNEPRTVLFCTPCIEVASSWHWLSDCFPDSGTKTLVVVLHIEKLKP